MRAPPAAAPASSHRVWVARGCASTRSLCVPVCRASAFLKRAGVAVCACVSFRDGEVCIQYHLVLTAASVRLQRKLSAFI